MITSTYLILYVNAAQYSRKELKLDVVGLDLLSVPKITTLELSTTSIIEQVNI